MLLFLTIVQLIYFVYIFRTEWTFFQAAFFSIGFEANNFEKNTLQADLVGCCYVLPDLDARHLTSSLDSQRHIPNEK